MMTISNDGVPIGFDAIGEGKPLVLLHGFLATRNCWKDLGYIDRLVSGGRCCIPIDARGHGESGKPDESALYTQAKRAGDVLAVLDKLGIDQADIFGFSMGGWIGIGVAQSSPCRVRSLIINGAHCYSQSLEILREAISPNFEGWIEHIEGLLGTKVSACFSAQLLKNDLAAIKACVSVDRTDTAAVFYEYHGRVLPIVGTLDPLFRQMQNFADATGVKLFALQDRNRMTGFLSVKQISKAVLEFLSEVDQRESGRHSSSGSLHPVNSNFLSIILSGTGFPSIRARLFD